MTIIMSLFLGLVQGIAEFLPISSSGHLSILQNLFGLDPSDLLFNVLMHLGTLVSICAVYRKEIKEMISDGIDYLRMRGDTNLDEPVVLKPPARSLLFMLIGTLPMVLALIFSGFIDRLFGLPAFVGCALLVTGGLLFVSDRFFIKDKQVEKGRKTEKTMTLTDAIFIGLAQAAALLPGLSRSGTTISVGLARGLSGGFAVRYSLLLSIPAVLGATIVELYKAIRDGADFSLFPIYLAGFVVAAVIGFFAIQLIRRIMSKGKFGKFAYYCWGVGALTIVLSLILS